MTVLLEREFVVLVSGFVPCVLGCTATHGGLTSSPQENLLPSFKSMLHSRVRIQS